MLTTTPLYLALGGAILLVLTFAVIARRRQAKIGIGDGGDKVLQRRIRVQGNAAETLPLGLLMLVGLELAGGAQIALHVLGAMLILGRLLHAWGLAGSAGVSFGRMVGMLLTMAAYLGLIVALLWRFAAGA